MDASRSWEMRAIRCWSVSRFRRDVLQSTNILRYPTQPYRAQGAATALEDAAVLGNIFSHLSATSQIGPFLRAYERLRHKRASKTQASSRLNQAVFHLPDGAEQEARDAAMRDAMHFQLARVHVQLRGGLSDQADDIVEGPALHAGNPNQWADRAKSVEQFSYDADAAAERWWEDDGAALVRKLAAT